jgi:hypothetical protein
MFPARNRGPKVAIALVAVVLLALVAYAAIGPYLTVRALRIAIRDNDAAALAEQVDFPSLRSSLKAQLQDRLVRGAGADVQSSVLGALGLSIAGRAADGAVDMMVTPLGLGAAMQGRILLSRFNGSFRPSEPVGDGDPTPFRDAVYRYESPSRFTATTHTGTGAPIVLVLTRKGIHWRLSDLRLRP